MSSAVNGGSEAESFRPLTGRLFALIAGLALAGMIVSAISLQRHYARSSTAFCDFGQQFNCDIVNRSEYSSIVGIPVAAIGIAGYLFLFVLSVFYRTRSEIRLAIMIAAACGLFFALYLTYIEAYILNTWCILCLISLLLISLIAMLAAIAKFSSA